MKGAWKKEGPFCQEMSPVKGDYLQVWDPPHTRVFWEVFVGSKVSARGTSNTVTQAKIDSAHYYRALKEASKA